MSVKRSVSLICAVALLGALLLTTASPAEALSRAQKESDIPVEIEPHTTDFSDEFQVDQSAEYPDALPVSGEVAAEGAEQQLASQARNIEARNKQVVHRGLWGDIRNRRIGGADRYQTAVLLSKDTYPNPSAVSTVIIATGSDFPDSLSATPLAAKLGAPLLMTQPTRLSDATRAEIQRLHPSTIIVIGGTGAVSVGVEEQLQGLIAGDVNVVRYGGVDRYETSVKIASAGWNGSQPDVFFATGLDFPDALSAGAAAGSMKAPVILVPGKQNRLGPQTRNFITSKKTSTVHIVGGSSTVSESIANHAKTFDSVKKVTRYSGSDRYATSAAVANAIFTKPTATYIANGLEFPDALSGSAVAGAMQAPLLLAQKTCIPTVIYDENDRLLPDNTTLLGGSGALSLSVQHGNECMSKPKGASSASFAGMQQLYTTINKARFENGRTGFRLADSRAGTPAYSWASSKKFSRNTTLAKQQPWVFNEAIARAPVNNSEQVSYIYNLIIKDEKNGTRNALLRTYGGVRPYISVGYVSGSPGYAAVYTGTAP